MSLKNPHGRGGGGCQNVHVCPQGGRGGSKNPKKLSTWFVDGPLTETPSVILPGMHVVCLENFSNPDLANGLHISQGDIIEGEKSYLVNRVFSTD